MFAARFLFRLKDYLPIRAAAPGLGILWSDFMSGMLRMFHASEIGIGVLKTEGRDPVGDEFMEFQNHANVGILTDDPDWYQKALQTLAARCGLDTLSLLDRLAQEPPVTDAMRHIQMGSPEHIRIMERI